MKKGLMERLLGIGLVVALVIGLCPITPVKAEPSRETEVYYGDLNDDGVVNAKDVTLLRRYLASGWGVVVDEDRADVNSDGVVNAKDVTVLRRYLAGGWGVVLPKKPDDVITYPVPIDEDHFPDQLFRNYVLTDFDENEDKMLSKEEAEEYSGICLGSDFKVKDLTGIQYFPKLSRLECHSNLLTSIDVSKNVALERLVLNGTQLTELDLSSNTALKYLLCGRNSFSTVDLGNNSELEQCYLFNNNLESLDVSKNTKLTVLDCEGNKLSGLDLSSNVALRALCIYDNDFESVDLRNNPKLKEVVYDDGVEVLRNVEISEDVFSDPAFENYIKKFDLDSDGYLATDEIAAVKDIDISNTDVKTIRGIEIFRHLDSFKCSNSKIEELCFTHYLDENTVVRVDTLDASKNPQLKRIYGWDMGIKTIDVSGDTGLEYLDVDENELEELDLGTNIALKSLYCSDNKLSELNLTNNTLLSRLYCNGNLFTKLNLSKNPELDESKVSVDSNVHVIWYSGDVTAVEINESNFPDDIFRQFVSENFDEDEDGSLSVEEILEVTYLGCGPSTYAYDQLGINEEDYGEDEDQYVYDLDRAEYNYYLAGNGIKSLKGIEYFPFVEEIICWYNQIEELDLSSNLNLVKLSCSYNALTSLDISQNSKLKYLNCKNNNLTTLDFSNNTFLEYLDASYNPITYIDITGTQVINGDIILPEGTVAKNGNDEMTFGAMGEVVRYVEKDGEGNVVWELYDIVYEDGLMTSFMEKERDGAIYKHFFTYYTNGRYKKESVIYPDGSREENNYREDGSLLSEIYVDDNGFSEETTYDWNNNEQAYVRKDADGKILKSKTWEYIQDDEGNITIYIVSDYDGNGLKVSEQGWSYESDCLLWTKTEILSSDAGMYYIEEGTEIFVPWQKLIDDGIIEVQYGAITKIDADRIKGRLEIQNGVTGLESGFWGSEIESVYIPRSLTRITINGGDASSFRYCYNLASMEVDPNNPVFDSRNNCNAIIDSESNTLILGCKTTVIPSDVVAIGDGAFMSSGLESIDIPGTIKKVGSSAFWDNRKLRTITLNEGLEYIGSSAFEDVELLETITIPSTVTYIGDMALAYNDSITSINVDSNNSKYDSRNNCNAIIETSTGRMIAGCINTVIPEGVKVIGPYALMAGHFGASIFDTESIVLPSTLERLEEYAIHGINYKHITFLGAPPEIEDNNFTLWDYNDYCYTPIADLVDITVPSEYLNDYKELLPQYAEKIIFVE